MNHKNPEIAESILRYIDEYKDTCSGCSPSVREIADGLGITKSRVSYYMVAMRNEGILEYDGTRNITSTSSKQDASGFPRVPVLGAVSCGIPKFAEENIEEYVKLPVSMFGKGDFFVLRAKGDSMINAGIDDGDLVLVRQQSTAEYNQIVVALVDDDATLKRFRPEGDVVRLHAENPAYDDIITDRCIIQGVATKIIKDAV